MGGREGAAGAAATPAAFYLGLCRLRGSHPPPAATKTILYRRDDGAAVIPDSGPEIKNRCSPEAILEFFLASIPKSGLEIKNRCTKDGISRQIHAVIPKFTP